VYEADVSVTIKYEEIIEGGALEGFVNLLAEEFQ
jgi:hypothetical protein